MAYGDVKAGLCNSLGRTGSEAVKPSESGGAIDIGSDQLPPGEDDGGLATQIRREEVEAIDPWGLPSVPIDRKSQLPQTSGIYFCLKSRRVLYVGKTESADGFKGRWSDHHRYSQMLNEGDVMIAYWETPEDTDLLAIEARLIEMFNPEFNRTPIHHWKLQQENAQLRQVVAANAIQIKNDRAIFLASQIEEIWLAPNSCLKNSLAELIGSVWAAAAAPGRRQGESLVVRGKLVSMKYSTPFVHWAEQSPAVLSDLLMKTKTGLVALVELYSELAAEFESYHQSKNKG